MTHRYLLKYLFPLCYIAFASSAAAQHPADVQKLTADKDYFEALKIYESMPKRKVTVDATVAAAKSAWALSLPQKAIDEFEKALRDKSIDDIQRARLLLSRGIIEYQEDRFRVAILFAERVITLLKEASPLRSKAWLLWGESLARLKSYGAAEDKYLKALKESNSADLPAVYYLLGNAQFKLGKLEKARESFENIPLQHPNAPFAMRRLAEISLQEKKFDQGAFWLARGQRDFPDHFIDSWVDYALLQIAIHQDNKDSVMAIQEKALKKYPPSDEWLSLLNAAVEEFLWKDRLEEKK
ncbi:MAG: tetratricopeptide repeat protein [Bdellovibrionota bacterium]